VVARIDPHTHTTASGGALSPSGLILDEPTPSLDAKAAALAFPNVG